MMFGWTLLFPPVCLGCGVLVRAGVPSALALCCGCAVEHAPLPANSIVQDDIWAVHAYAGPVLRALVRLKFGGQRAWAGPLGAALATSPIVEQPWDALVPIPLHPTRLRERGYNQSALLAAHLRKVGGHRPPPLRPQWLRRVRATQAQHRLPARQRLNNVGDAFACPHPEHLRGRRILLIDDVTTTGATLSAARSVVQRAGADRVGALALLRTVA